MTTLAKSRLGRKAIRVMCVLTIFLIAFLFSLTARSQLFVKYTDLVDSSVFQYIARSILEGNVPYRDTFDHKGPLLYLLNVLGLSISPRFGIWFIELITLFFSFFLMYKLANLFCEKITAVFVVMAILPVLQEYFQGGNFSEEYALPFICGGLYIFSDYFVNGKITIWRLILCGAFFGAVLLLRVNMIAIWVVMCIGVLIECISKKKSFQMVGFLVWFLVGALVIIMPFIVWFLWHGALRDFWESYFVFNVVYATEDQRVTIFSKVDTFSHFLHSTLTVISIGVFCVSFCKKKDMFSLLGLSCLLLTLLMISMSGHSFGHYGMIIIPILVIPLAYIGRGCDMCWNQNQITNIFIVVCLVVKLVMPVNQSMVENFVDSYQNRGTERIDDRVLTVSLWVQEVTTPDQKIIVCGNWNAVYNQSERFAASKYSYQGPICQINPEMEREFFEDLEENKPSVIVLPQNFYAKNNVINFANKYGYEEVFLDNLDDSVQLFQRR